MQINLIDTKVGKIDEIKMQSSATRASRAMPKNKALPKIILNGGFISLRNEDGEQNYIPIFNIEYLEADRAFIYPDDVWSDMGNQRGIENRQN
jgi:hypothetical protein